MLEVLHRVQVLIMGSMGSIKQKQEYLRWHMKKVHSTYELDPDRGHPCSLGSRECDVLAVDNQSKQILEGNPNLPCVVNFLGVFFATKIDFGASKMQSTANQTINEEDVPCLENEGAWGKQPAERSSYPSSRRVLAPSVLPASGKFQ